MTDIFALLLARQNVLTLVWAASSKAAGIADHLTLKGGTLQKWLKSFLQRELTGSLKREIKTRTTGS